MNDQKEEHFVGKVAQKAILYHQSKVLLVRDPREKTQIWEIPGGRLNRGESPQEGLKREIKEELGVECVIGEVVHLEQFFQTNENKNALVIVYEATLVNPDAALELDEREVAEIKWIDQNDLPQIHMFPEYSRALGVFFEKINRKHNT